MTARLFYRAIKLNIKRYKWDRALEIAVQNKTHIDTVIAYRQRYLERGSKVETNEKFIQYSKDIEFNWEDFPFDKIPKDIPIIVISAGKSPQSKSTPSKRILPPKP